MTRRWRRALDSEIPPVRLPGIAVGLYALGLLGFTSFAVVAGGPLRYWRALGRPLASDVLLSIAAANLIGGLLLAILVGDGERVRAAEAWIAARVPTLVVVPAPFALVGASAV